MLRDKRKWKSSEWALLAAPLFVLAAWLVWSRASKYLQEPLRFGHLGYTRQVVFSPDGKYLLSYGANNNRADAVEVALWEMPSGAISQLVQRPAGVRAVAFSPDGSMIAVSSGTSVELWDRNLKKQISALALAPDKPNAITFSPEGRTLAVGIMSPRPWARNEPYLFDLSTGKRKGRVRSRLYNTISLAFLSDSRRVLSLTSDYNSPSVGLQEFDAQAGNELKRWPCPQFWQWGRVFTLSSDGKMLAVPFSAGGGGQHGIAMLDAQSQALLWKQPSVGVSTTALAISSKRKWLAEAAHGIQIRDARTGALKTSYENGGDEQNDVQSLAFSPNNKYLAVAGKTIELRDISHLTQP